MSTVKEDEENTSAAKTIEKGAQGDTDARMLRDLDKEIIEKVFGVRKVFRPCDVKITNGDISWQWCEDYHYIPSGKPPRTHMIDARTVPYFSTDISAAWQIVEKMQEQGLSCRIAVANSAQTGVAFYRAAGAQYILVEEMACAGLAVVSNAPEAICRAALQVTKTP